MTDSGDGDGAAFGLRIAADFDIDGLNGASGAEIGKTVIRTRSQAEIGAAWPDTATTTVDLRLASGESVLRVEHAENEGYFVWSADGARLLISPDGGRIDCTAPADEWRWRLLFAQGLPIAAALQGIEVLHASAVALGRRAIAITGPTGAGKTSLAAELILQGAELVADDVVAVDPGTHGVGVHAGIRVANVTATLGDELVTKGGARLVGRSDKTHVRLPAVPSPLQLEALIFLERDQPVEAVELEYVDPPDPWRILGSTFVFHVATEHRRVRQLDIALALARGTRMLCLRVPSDVGPRALARALRGRLESLLG